MHATPKRGLEEELRQPQKREDVRRLTRGIAHDLNNVLAAILGCADLLAIRLQKNGPALEEAREIQKAAERGATLIQHLLALSPQTPKSSPPHPRRRAARSRTGSRKKSSNRR